MVVRPQPGVTPPPPRRTTSRAWRGATRVLGAALSVASLAGCALFGLGGIQPDQVEGEWHFRAEPGNACGVDTLRVLLRDGDRTWGSFFVSGEARVAADSLSAAPLPLRHGRVIPKTGAFTLVFSDREVPEHTEQMDLEGRFSGADTVSAIFTRLVPEPDCSTAVQGRRVR